MLKGRLTVESKTKNKVFFLPLTCLLVYSYFVQGVRSKLYKTYE
jgi:hypothetical protein